MAIGSIELATIARSQDYSSIKQNENAKVHVDQSNIGVQINRDVQQKIRQVHDSEEPEWHNRKFDAKEKGNGQYAGNGGQNRKKQQAEDGTIRVKNQVGFDVKI